MFGKRFVFAFQYLLSWRFVSKPLQKNLLNLRGKITNEKELFQEIFIINHDSYYDYELLGVGYTHRN